LLSFFVLIRFPPIPSDLRLNILGSAMLERIYQEQESEELLDDSADARLLRPGTESA